jgi:CheY-like chemotaxis protein
MPERRVLVADDDPGTRELVRISLGFGHFSVVEAVDGAEALELARSQPFDLVLLDVMMPKSDGLSTCRELKADPATTDVPIVLLTGVVTDEVRRRAVEAGAEAFLAKPFSPKALLDRVESLLADQI